MLVLCGQLSVVHLSPRSKQMLARFWILALKWRAKGSVTVAHSAWPREQLSLFLTWLFVVCMTLYSWTMFFFSWFLFTQVFLMGFFFFFLIRWDLQEETDITFQGLLLLLHWPTDTISPGVKRLGWEPQLTKILLQGVGVFCHITPYEFTLSLLCCLFLISHSTPTPWKKWLF